MPKYAVREGVDVNQITGSIEVSAAQGHREPRHDSRFDHKAMTALFLKTMDEILYGKCGYV